MILVVQRVSRYVLCHGSQDSHCAMGLTTHYRIRPPCDSNWCSHSEVGTEPRYQYAVEGPAWLELGFRLGFRVQPVVGPLLAVAYTAAVVAVPQQWLQLVELRLAVATIRIRVAERVRKCQKGSERVRKGQGGCCREYGQGQ